MSSYFHRKLPLSIGKYIIGSFSITVASAVVLIWGTYPNAPTPVKLLFSSAVWLNIFLFPWSWIRYNDFPKYAKWILNLMLFWGLFEILRSLLGFSEASSQGNKYLTLFFNEYCALIFIPPLFAYTVCKYNVLSILFRLTKVYFWLCTVLSLILLRVPFVSKLSVYIIVFWDFIQKRDKLLIVIVMMCSFISAVLGDRKIFIFLLYTSVAYLVCYRWSLRVIQKLVCIFSVCLPAFLFFPLMLADQKEGSYFQIILNGVNDAVGGDDDLKTDTRTFLYMEVGADLLRYDAWFLGKGANSTYYSSYFSKAVDGDVADRISVEVPVLLFMLRGGLVYTLLYLVFFLFGIYNAVWRGRSKFINCVGIILSGWFANSFVGDVNGCSFYHLVLFSLCGITLSRKWLNKSDEEIKYLINTEAIVRI